VAAGLRAVDALLVEEEVVGVELLVLKVVVDGAGEVVGARLGDELEVAAARAARRGVVERGLELDLLKRLGGGRDIVVE